MPVATIPDTITRPEELIEYLAQYFTSNEIFGEFKYLAKYDEDLIPKYPALHIMPGNFDKTLHATSTFAIQLRATVHVLHANYMIDRQTRNYEDLALATKVVDFLEGDMTLGGHVIQGWVENEIPGVLPPRVTKADAVVSTRLNWVGIAQRRFK